MVKYCLSGMNFRHPHLIQCLTRKPLNGRETGVNDNGDDDGDVGYPKFISDGQSHTTHTHHAVVKQQHQQHHHLDHECVL